MQKSQLKKQDLGIFIETAPQALPFFKMHSVVVNKKYHQMPETWIHFHNNVQFDSS